MIINYTTHKENKQRIVKANKQYKRPQIVRAHSLMSQNKKETTVQVMISSMLSLELLPEKA